MTNALSYVISDMYKHAIFLFKCTYRHWIQSISNLNPV